MIKTYRNKVTEQAHQGLFNHKIPTTITKRVKMRLDRIHAAVNIDDLRVPPSHRLKALKGDRAGQYSIRDNNQYRICFVWKDGNAFDVELVDYH